ncbi:hypothetical protein [Arenicella chitinivorans]|uniref:hypothetical protein n=1 Tax=Arenicella chitinivorans TaxID=1329800 RepID=UPI0016740BA4|nr:hypothetical protein [Arenicella chitinivorans]
MTTLLLAILLFTPAMAGFYSDHQLRSAIENRTLTTFPDLSAKTIWSNLRGDTSIQKQTSHFVDDHIGFALPLNQMYRRFLFYRLGESPNRRVFRTQDGFVFLSYHASTKFSAINGSCPDYNAARLNRSQQNLRTFLQSLQDKSARLAVTVYPSKPNVYPEELHSGVPAETRRRCDTAKILREINAGRQTSEEFNAIFHYPLDEFKQQRDTAYFYPPQNFHAFGMSTSLFATSLLKKLEIQVPDDVNDGKRLVARGSDLSMFIGFIAEGQAWHIPYAERGISLQPTDWIAQALDSDPSITRAHTTQYLTQNPLSNKRALVISNSFGTYTARDLAIGYRSLTQININMLPDGGMSNFLASDVFKERYDDIIIVLHDAEMVANGTLGRLQM